jgi:hypothetical protein
MCEAAYPVRDPVQLLDGYFAGLFISIGYPDRMDSTVEKGQSGRQERAGQY